MRNSLPIDFAFFTLSGGTPLNIAGNTNANVALPDNCYAIDIKSGDKAVKFKFVGHSISPSAFFTDTDASFLPAYSTVRLHVGVSSARVGSPYIFFDRASGDNTNLFLTLCMEANS